ncbi:hypothetical protein N9295_00780, partial [bacterium]|nr:hypothetical protein [bacterium]
GMSIGEVFHGSSNTPVFALSRGDRLMWNPESSIQLRFDDVLICYGELDSLRATLRKAMSNSPRSTTDAPTGEESNA